MAEKENNEAKPAYLDSNGKFAAGNPGKPKGAASNASAKVKAAIQKFLEDNIEEVQKSFDTLKPIEKLQFIANILPYAIPKMQSVEAKHEGEVTSQITVTWVKPNELPDFTNESGMGNQPGDRAGV